MQALAKQTAFCQRVKDTHRFLLLKCTTDPAINAEHIGMNREILRPLAKAFGRCKEMATKPVLKIVLYEFKDKKAVTVTNKVVASTASVLKKLSFAQSAEAFRTANHKARSSDMVHRAPSFTIRYNNIGKKQQKKLDFEKPELDREVKRVEVPVETDLPSLESQIHGLKYRQAKAKDGTDFGEVPKEERGILKKEIRRSKL
ncbi:nipblb, partial [Symbiodinium necroappetens]